MNTDTFFLLTIGHCLAETFWENDLSFVLPANNSDDVYFYNKTKYNRVVIILLAWFAIISVLCKTNYNVSQLVPLTILIYWSIAFSLTSIFPRESTILYGAGLIIAFIFLLYEDNLTNFTYKSIRTTYLLFITIFSYYLVMVIGDIHIMNGSDNYITNRHRLSLGLCGMFLLMYLQVNHDSSALLDLIYIISYIALISYNLYYGFVGHSTVN